MPTPHLEAKPGDIAEIVLLPGDPLRAKYIADTFLQDVTQYNAVRNALGFTGTYKGLKISVQGTGMGMPSAMIYTEELVREYGAKVLIRIGSAGGMKEDVQIRDVVLGQAATTDASLHRNIFHNQVDYAPIADFGLLKTAYEVGEERGFPIKVGNILSSDRFYNDELDMKKLADYGVMAVEMEAAGIYSVAAKHKVKALTILTISDHILTGEETSSEERQTSFEDMMVVALETALQTEL